MWSFESEFFPRASKMDSINIDNLLRNYMVSDVLQVQKKLKNDAKKKENDLKQLIGERYGELFKAADSFEKMNSSIDTLIHSLRKLNGLNREIQEKQNRKDLDVPDSLEQNDFSTAKLYKILFDLPLQIWNHLHDENFVLATYSYLYGKHVTEIISDRFQKEPSKISDELFFTRSRCIEIISENIIRNSWRYLQKHSTKNEIDQLKFAETFSCLVILKNLSISDLLVQFFEKQTNNVHYRLKTETPISSLIVTVSNIIFNTIKSSKLFDKDSNDRSVFSKTLESILSTNFLSTHAICDTKHLPENLRYFIIKSLMQTHQLRIVDHDNQSPSQSIEKWIESGREQFFPIIQERFKIIKSIKELSIEIQTAEKNLYEGNVFSAWKKFTNIMDLKTKIWQAWFIDAFENRIYEIAEERLKSMVDSFVSLLPKFKKTLANCDLSIVEYVWKSQNAKNSEFISMINKSCEIIDVEMKSLHEEIVIFKGKYPNFIVKICSNINQFLLQLKQHIDSYKMQQSFILFGAIFFKKITEQCSNLRSIFETRSDWNQLEEQISSISESYLLEWFTIVITEHFSGLEPTRLTDLEHFLRNLSLWETVSLLPSDNNETPSVFEVPFQLSLITFQVLQNICVDMNRYCAHFVPRNVLIEILILMGRHLIDLYDKSAQNLRSNDSIPQTCKQIISLQLYFDLFFIKKIFNSSKDERLRIGYPSKINEILTNLEANIDPFDMHLIHPHIETNSDKLHKSFQITFGFLFADRYSISSVQAAMGEGASKEVIHNFMLIHSCQDEFKVITDPKSVAQNL